MLINPTKLAQELKGAGITTHGNCNSDGVVWDDDNNEIQDRKDVQAVLKAHDPAEIPVETLEEKIERIIDKKLNNGIITKRR